MITLQLDVDGSIGHQLSEVAREHAYGADAVQRFLSGVLYHSAP